MELGSTYPDSSHHFMFLLSNLACLLKPPVSIGKQMRSPCAAQKHPASKHISSVQLQPPVPAVPREEVSSYRGPLGSCCAQAAPSPLNKQLLSAVTPMLCMFMTGMGPSPSPHSSWISAPTQVKSVNLSDGEVLSIRGVDGDALVVLANQTLLVEGQVIRSPTNTISVYFRTFQDEVVGTFQLHYQGGCLGARGARGGVGWGVGAVGLSLQ